MDQSDANEFFYVSKNLRRYRMARGLSTYTLAVRAGVSRPTICSIENGRTSDVMLRTVMRLGAAMGLSGWMLCVPPESTTSTAA